MGYIEPRYGYFFCDRCKGQVDTRDDLNEVSIKSTSGKHKNIEICDCCENLLWQRVEWFIEDGIKNRAR